MTNPNEILYPQVSSIYNKLMQLGVGIILIILILNLSVVNSSDNKQQITKHFQQVSSAFVKQAVNSSRILLAAKDKKQLHSFINSLTESAAVTEAILYDKNGQIIAKSEGATSVKELYGVAQGSDDSSATHIAFIEEIRGETLQGYLRLNIIKDVLIKPLEVQQRSQDELFRIMLLMSVFAGFLLTRGYNRFSRQGFRLPKRK